MHQPQKISGLDQQLHEIFVLDSQQQTLHIELAFVMSPKQNQTTVMMRMQMKGVSAMKVAQ
jgi:hypothetical protein